MDPNDLMDMFDFDDDMWSVFKSLILSREVDLINLNSGHYNSSL
jgi:hypothetical protein